MSVYPKIAPNVFKVNVEAQGRLLRVQHVSKTTRFESYSHRGDVTSFSSKSRKRMLDMFASLDSNVLEHQAQRPRFITLTYRRNMTNQRVMARDLQVFIKRAQRLAPTSSLIWRVERQKRGAWHAHVIWINGKHWDKAKMAEAWAEITNEPRNENGQGGITQIAAMKSHKQLMYYVSKYAAKPTNPDVFISKPYSPEREAPTWNPYQWVDKGRHWGVQGRQCLPVAPIERFSVTSDAVAFQDWIKLLQRKYEDLWCFINVDGGFSLYIDDAASTIDLYHTAKRLTFQYGHSLYLQEQVS